MDYKNLVSVIMPAYNHQNYVKEAIKSIINQTYKNIELKAKPQAIEKEEVNKVIEVVNA